MKKAAEKKEYIDYLINDLRRQGFQIGEADRKKTAWIFNENGEKIGIFDFKKSEITAL